MSIIQTTSLTFSTMTQQLEEDHWRSNAGALLKGLNRSLDAREEGEEGPLFVIADKYQ